MCERGDIPCHKTNPSYCIIDIFFSGNLTTDDLDALTNHKPHLSIDKLKAGYGEMEILHDIDLRIGDGQSLCLIGPNGAGKTTFINILAGTVIKTSGEVIVWGFDLDKNPRQVRASIGIVPQEVNLDPFFSPKKILELQAGLYGIKKEDQITDTILKLVSLEKQANSYARSLSGGMKRRLLMAKALVHQPPIIFLDEPTAGVDVELRKNLWDNVKELNKEGDEKLKENNAVEELTDAKIEWDIPHSSPGLTNDSACTDIVIEAAKSALGEENVEIMKDSSMGGEDFAYYLEKIPGAYFRIGCNDGKTRDIHTNDFNLDEQCMATAIKVFAESVAQYFQSHKS